MSKKTPLCAICLLAVIAIASFAFVYLILHHHKPCKNGECLVKTDLGHLKGLESETALNKKTYYSFQGIPYAKPPVGDSRFRDPEPIEHWHSVLDATKEENICLQRGASRKYGDVQGSEDCLYLNIYTTQFPDHDITRHPVLVYFHSGGFNYGSASKDHLGPDYIIERDVILVTVNYRLGALGFLNLNNEDVPGNAGLKDQQLALRWVKEHIGHFGGDPNNVMIFGSSAGAASVQYHMLSPSSAGLFQKAIMESGSVLNPWAFDEDPLKRAHALASKLNINSTDTKEIADILRKKSPLDIIHFQEKVRTPEELKRCISFPFVPSVETHVYENSFLVEHPKLLLEEKRINIVPTIIGANTNEGLITLTRSDFKEKFSTDFEKFIPADLHLNQNNPYFPKVIESVKEFYFHNKLPSFDDLDNYFKTCGDIEFNLGIQKTIDYLLRQSDIPVYVYKFSFDGKFKTLKSYVKEKYPTIKLPPGPNHADEGSYLFYAKQTNNLTEYGTELEVVERITTLWTRFATFQDPNIEGSEVHWIPTKADNQTHLDIGTSLTVVNDSLLPQDRLEFWNKIYSEVLAK